MDSTPAGTSAEIFNLTLTDAGVEYSQVLHDGNISTPLVKAIMFRPRTATHSLQYAFKTGGPYFDLLDGEVYWKDGLAMFAVSIYFKSPDAGAIVDIEVWK